MLAIPTAVSWKAEKRRVSVRRAGTPRVTCLLTDELPASQVMVSDQLLLLCFAMRGERIEKHRL